MDLSERLEAVSVCADPFPHVVVEDALPADLCAALVREMPPLEILTRGAPPESNKRFSLGAADILAEPRISETWKRVVREGLSQRLLDRVLALFAPHIRREHPGLEATFGPLAALTAVPRQVRDRPLASVGVDAQIAVDTPALEPATSVRGPHLDYNDKLFTGLLYLRAPDDRSTGGELELYAPVAERLTFALHRQVAPESVRPSRTVPYRSGTLVMFVNTARSLHGVTPRSATPFPRYHINLVGEMSRRLFEIDAPSAPAAVPPQQAPAAPRLARLWRAIRG
jgi:hypothetical protein